LIPAKKVYLDPIETNHRLADLGLTEPMLTESVDRGLAAWASCTANHPPQFAGISMWAEATCRVRELLIPEGWNRLNECNLPLTVNAAGTIAISVSSGDEFTGDATNEPCTKSSKGPRTRIAVADNEAQYKLFPDMALTPEDLKNLGARETWILLFHRNYENHEVRCELSRPINISAEGKVDGWAERIILKSRPFGGDRLEIHNAEPPQTPDIKVNISRRA